MIAALILAFLAPQERVQDPAPDFFCAPSGRWTMSGGSPARNGASLAQPLREEPVVAWDVDLRHPIESEPLVWDGRVFVVAREGTDRRGLFVFELETGRTLLHRVLPSSVPLEPSLFGDRLAVRAAENRVDVYRVGTRLLLLRSFHAERSISPPCLAEGELYVRVDDALARYDLDRREAVWSTGGAVRIRGAPALGTDAVFALAYDEQGRALVLHVSRSDGSVVEQAEAGQHGGAVPELGARASLHLLARDLLLEFPLPVTSTQGKEFRFGRLQRSGDRFEPVPVSLHDWLVPPVYLGTGWIVLEEAEGGPRWIATLRDESALRFATLADGTSHPELLERIPATRAGTRARELVYVGGLAADARTWEVLWRRRPPLFRAIPAEGFLLVVEEPTRIAALREPEPEPDPPALEARKLAAKLDETLADGYALLAQRSLRAGDAALTARLLAEAGLLGAKSRAVELVQDGLDRLRGRPPRPDPRGVSLILEEEKRLAAHPIEELLARARGAGDPALARSFLRQLFGRAHDDEGAIELVRSLVPADAPIGSEFDAASWLDFLDVYARTPVRFLDLARAAQGSSEHEILAAQARAWRQDLVGFRSERLHVVTRPGEPGDVARALELGERVCDMLEGIFAHRPAGANTEPMTLLLYGSQREYMEQSQKARSGPEAALGWTVGHYNGAENLSRMFVPEDDALLREFLGTYAHELTHHWLATRASFATRMQPPDVPGYWVAEGFASMIEEFKFDVRTREWTTENPRAHSLDVVANAPSQALLPWDSLFTLSWQDFSKLDSAPKTSFPLTWRLGVLAEASEVQLFYAQAAAAAHYLFRSSPETKQALLDAVEAWYQADDKGVNQPLVVGIGPGELGERIRAFAREATVADAPLRD